MKETIPATALVLALATTSLAIPIRALEYGPVSDREHGVADDECFLAYYNTCSGQGVWWTGYCGTEWDIDSIPEPAQFGTCFDLADCPGNCRHLEEVWWAGRYFTCREHVDVEIYCADSDCCPVGPPLAGIYDYAVGCDGEDWRCFDFDGLELCTCEPVPPDEPRFIVMVTAIFWYHGGGGYCYAFPWSDFNAANLDDGCEADWRCSGHSYVYRGAVTYCEIYGTPAPLWVSGPDYGCTNPPAVPPGCHGSNGFFSEWLIHCYLSCEGPTATDKTSWSEIKGLYR